MSRIKDQLSCTPALIVIFLIWTCIHMGILFSFEYFSQPIFFTFLGYNLPLHLPVIRDTIDPIIIVPNMPTVPNHWYDNIYSRRKPVLYFERKKMHVIIRHLRCHAFYGILFKIKCVDIHCIIGLLPYAFGYIFILSVFTEKPSSLYSNNNT